MTVFFRRIHLYLSLAAGLVIGLVCLTGAILVFEKEWQQTLYPERYRVEAAGTSLPLDQLVRTVGQKVPEAKISSVKVYADPTRTVEISYGAEKEKAGGKAPEDRKAGKGGPGKGPEGGKGGGNQAYLNPYTGQLLATSSQKASFFATTMQLHRWLLVGDTGKFIVGCSTVLFLFILLTGIVLWWPQNRRILQQRLKLKLDGGWKRINHDLHIVVGFYSALFLFVFAFTGLAWSFKWFNDGIYWITGTENKQPEPPQSTLVPQAKPISFDQALAVARQQIPGADFYTISKAKGDSASITVMALPQNAVHERATTQLFLDQYSGQPLKLIRFEDKNLGQRVRGTFYPVHVGSIGGLPGRIIAFLACVAGFTFPITGVILWINRLRKKKGRKVRTAVAA